MSTSTNHNYYFGQDDDYLLMSTEQMFIGILSLSLYIRIYMTRLKALQSVSHVSFTCNWYAVRLCWIFIEHKTLCTKSVNTMERTNERTNSATCMANKSIKLRLHNIYKCTQNRKLTDFGMMVCYTEFHTFEILQNEEKYYISKTLCVHFCK